MRTRKEIWDDDKTEELILEVLLDIRDLLYEQNNDVQN